MSRAVPWRNKPTPLITQMLPVAKQLKLYLVNQLGPTSLILKDDNQNKFKVVIGNTVNCSCGVVKNDHCIHSLFVMLKKFKVSENQPIIWQASYLDSELDAMTQQKYQQQVKSKVKVSAKDFLKRTKKQKKSQEEDDFPPLDDDEMCPICYEEMNGQCYSTCNTCHKSLHTKCFKVWTKHKQDSQSPVTCPMCRNKFITPMNIIFRDLERWQSRFSTHKGSQCKGCGQKNIKGLIYKCLVCPQTDLCKLCYEGNQHIEHDIFCVKQIATDKWRLAPLRVKKTRKQLFQPIEDLNVRQLPALQAKQFILQLLPTLKQFNSKQAKSELGIVGNELLSKNYCSKCRTQGNEQMIRLNCSHPIHLQCLLSKVQNREYLCQMDHQIICSGYWTALGIKVTKPTKKTPMDLKFIKNNEQIQLIERKNATIKTISGVNVNISGKNDTRNMSMGSMKQVLGGVNRISGIKMKQLKNNRAPTMPKKTTMERRQQIQSLAIGGLGMGSGLTSNFGSIGIHNIGQISSLNLGIPFSGKTSSTLKHPPKLGLFSNKLIQR